MIRDTLDIYNRNLVNIIIVSCILVIPVTIFLLLAGQYMYELNIEQPYIPIFSLLF